MPGKMGHFGGYLWLFWGCGGVPSGPGWGNDPSQMYMSEYDEEKCDWCGYLWWHDITLPFETNLLLKNTFFAHFLVVFGPLNHSYNSHKFSLLKTSFAYHTLYI